MRKRRGSDDPSMDSLMDTLTNVVGILMFVLMITMLSVNDAVKQIIRAEAGFEKKEVSEQDIAKAQAQAAQLRLEVQTLAASEPEVKAAIGAERIELAKLQDQVTLEQAQLKEPSKPLDVKQLQSQVEQQRQQMEQLQKQVVEAKQKAEQVGSELAETPELEELPAKIVRLPDPRTPPEGMAAELFFCREGRVMHVNSDALVKLALRLAQQFAKPEKDGTIDCEQLVDAFEKRNVGDEFFRIRIQVLNGHPYAMFERKPDAGDTLEQVEQTTSDYQRRLRTLNSKKQYCRFVVWPDSFDVYLRARELADERGMLAGWQPDLRTGEWFPVYIPGLSHFRCKGAPPPPPPNPNAPAPPAPPKPMDVID